MFNFLGLRNHPGNPTGAEELLKKCQALIETSLNEENYKDKFTFLVQCEEHQMNIDIRNYDMEVWNEMFKIQCFKFQKYILFNISKNKCRKIFEKLFHKF